MKIDLFKLNNLGKIQVDSDYDIKDTTNDIKKVDKCHVNGEFSIDYSDNIVFNGSISGTLILIDAYSLEDVPYDFNIELEDEILGKFEDFYRINKNSLDIFPFIWENIISEVPIRVTKNGKLLKTSGYGWKVNN